MRDRAILVYLTTAAWAIHQPTLEKLAGIVARHAAGIRLDDAAMEEFRQANARHGDGDDDAGSQIRVDGGVAIVPVHGVITKHSPAVSDISQPRGTSGTQIIQGIEAAVGDSRVHTILLHVDSPGGSVDGVTDVTDAIRSAREHKRVVAFADGNMASLAMWIASQAEVIIAAPTSAVGAIGVYQVLHDTSAAADAEGVKVHVVRAGATKGLGEPGAEISDEQLAAVQANVDAYYDLFVDAVASGRDIDRAKALELADGRLHIGEQAVTAGLADRVASFTDTLADLNENTPHTDQLRAWSQKAARPAQSEERDMTKPSTQMPTTQAELEAAFPEIVASIRTDAASAAVADERERITFIRAEAMEFQADLVEKLIVDGSSEDDAIKVLFRDVKENGPKRAEASVSDQSLAPIDPDPDGSGDGKPRAYDEKSRSWEGEHPREDADYLVCEDEDAVTTLAKVEFKKLPVSEQKSLGGVAIFCAMRRSEFHDRQRVAAY